MALYYGKSTATAVTPKQRKYLTYSWNYAATNSGTKKRPAELISDYPTPYAATYGLDEESTITFLTHKFDNDETISPPFKMEYKMWCMLRDGKEANILVWTTDLIPNHRIGSNNVFALNKTIKFKDVWNKYKDMVSFQVEIKCIRGSRFGNESMLDILLTI